jgi:hypothetical protein
MRTGQDMVAGIVQLQQTTDGANTHNRKRRAQATRPTGKTEYSVQWQPSIMQEWQQQLAFTVGGYSATRVEKVTQAEVRALEHKVTECCHCNYHIGTQDDDMDPTIDCNICWRTYHISCLPIATRPKPEGVQHWKCRECTTNEYTAKTLPGTLRWCRVHWPDTTEPAAFLKDNPQLQPMVHQQHPHPTPQHEDPPLDDMERQGDLYPHHDSRYDVTIGQHCRTKLLASTAECDPHVDIEGTGKYEIYVRDVDRRENGVTHTKRFACVYTPDGHCKFMMPEERAQLLTAAYVRMRHNHPKLVAKLKGGTPAEELYKLLCRNQKAAVVEGSTGKTVAYTEEQMLPQEVVQMLAERLGPLQERFASPLNCSKHTAVYWSMHKRDKLFGALYDSRLYTTSTAGLPSATPQMMIKRCTSALEMLWKMPCTPTLQYSQYILSLPLTLQVAYLATCGTFKAIPTCVWS